MLLRIVAFRPLEWTDPSCLVAFAGCRTASSSQPTEETPGPRSVSLYEDRLLNVIKRQQALEAYAIEATDREWPEVDRRFRDIAASFQSIVADNPEEVEARLIYGKFLDFFGDHDGARDQFMEVLRVDPTVAVAHQQLGTYFAEHGEPGKALAYYFRATEHAPEEPFYHFGMGELLQAHRSEILEDAALSTDVWEREMLQAFQRAHTLAPGNPVYAFRYGEALMNLEQPDWQATLDHWRTFEERPELSQLQAETLRLHQALCLVALERPEDALPLALSIETEELIAARDAVLETINEATGASDAAE